VGSWDFSGNINKWNQMSYLWNRKYIVKSCIEKVKSCSLRLRVWEMNLKIKNVRYSINVIDVLFNWKKSIYIFMHCCLLTVNTFAEIKILPAVWTLWFCFSSECIKSCCRNCVLGKLIGILQVRCSHTCLRMRIYSEKSVVEWFCHCGIF
jgi:hypothetical protein